MVEARQLEVKNRRRHRFKKSLQQRGQIRKKSRQGQVKIVKFILLLW